MADREYYVCPDCSNKTYEHGNDTKAVRMGLAVYGFRSPINAFIFDLQSDDTVLSTATARMTRAQHIHPPLLHLPRCVRRHRCDDFAVLAIVMGLFVILFVLADLIQLVGVQDTEHMDVLSEIYSRGDIIVDEFETLVNVKVDDMYTAPVADTAEVDELTTTDRVERELAAETR